MNIDYKSKALKYKKKYKKLLEKMNSLQIGGNHNEPYTWLNNFKNELSSFYEEISLTIGEPLLVTGSTAIMLYLDHYEKFTSNIKQKLQTIKRNDQMEEYIPGDFDFLYLSFEKENINPISNTSFNINGNEYNRVQNAPHRSLTFQSVDQENNELIKKFDLTKNKPLPFVIMNINNIQVKVLEINKLIDFYNFSDISNTNDSVKREILLELINYIKYECPNDKKLEIERLSNESNLTTTETDYSIFNRVSSENFKYDSPTKVKKDVPEDNIDENSPVSDVNVRRGALFEDSDVEESPPKKTRSETNFQNGGNTLSETSLEL